MKTRAADGQRTDRAAGSREPFQGPGSLGRTRSPYHCNPRSCHESTAWEAAQKQAVEDALELCSYPQGRDSRISRGGKEEHSLGK